MAKKSQKTRSSVIHAQQVSYSGPLPIPRHFQQYEAILPGAADRILKQAESQTEHRQFIEKQVIASNIKKERIGMYFSFIISISVVIGGILIVIIGKDPYGYAAILGAPALTGAIFLGTKHIEKKKIREN